MQGFRHPITSNKVNILSQGLPRTILSYWIRLDVLIIAAYILTTLLIDSDYSIQYLIHLHSHTIIIYQIVLFILNFTLFSTRSALVHRLFKILEMHINSKDYIKLNNFIKANLEDESLEDSGESHG
jgi:hypothetical protein